MLLEAVKRHMENCLAKRKFPEKHKEGVKSLKMQHPKKQNFSFGTDSMQNYANAEK